MAATNDRTAGLAKTLERIRAFRLIDDDFMQVCFQENIPCTTENSYVIINPMIEPGFKNMKYKSLEFVEMRGLWEAYNDFMGGPYVSHSFVNPKTNEIIVLDAFVYAPKYPKRNYLRQV